MCTAVEFTKGFPKLRVIWLTTSLMSAKGKYYFTDTEIETQAKGTAWGYTTIKGWI